MSTLMIKHFADSTKEDFLKSVFSIAGKIECFKIIKDECGKSKGFGYLTFKDKESAERAIKFYNGKNILGATSLYVGFAKEKEERRGHQGTFGGGNIFIKNLDETIDEKRLENEFSLFGEIESVKILRDRENKSQGRGFVCFKSIEDSTRAVIVMNKKIIGTKPIFTEFAKNVSKEHRTFRDCYIKQLVEMGSAFQAEKRIINLSSSAQPSTSKYMHEQTEGSSASGKKIDFAESSSSKSLAAKTSRMKSESRKVKVSTNPFAGVLNKLSEQEQKKLLHQLLLPQVVNFHPYHGKKILEILIQLQVSELIKMFDDSSLLKAKCEGIINMMKTRADDILSSTKE